MAQLAESPFSPTLPTFQTSRVVSGVEISANRLNRFVRWLTVNANGCWIYGGPKTHNGYGTFGTGGRKGKELRAHRVAHELWIGPIPEGLDVLHSCDERPCCCPDHIRAGTAQDNTDDRVARGRSSAPKTVYRGVVRREFI